MFSPTHSRIKINVTQEDWRNDRQHDRLQEVLWLLPQQHGRHLPNTYFLLDCDKCFIEVPYLNLPTTLKAVLSLDHINRGSV